MPTIVRVADKPYNGRSAWRSSRTSPTRKRCCRATTSRADGFHITAKARRYLRPLIQGEDYPPYKDGLPQYVTLKNAPVQQEAGRDLCGIVRAPFLRSERI